jgi:cytochrome c oxidase subunit 3
LPSAAPAPEGLAAPAAKAAHEIPAPPNPQLFFGIYFAMTGLHGIHVLAGIVVISWLLVGALRGRYGPDYFTPVDLVGLYWHIVDMIWIFLFPLFYLIG